MDRDRVAGSAKKIKGSIKEVVGKESLAKPSRSRRRSDGSHVTETALIPDVVLPGPRQCYEDWGDHVPMFLLHSVSSSHPKREKNDLGK
jgi:hypothetical protein